MAYIWTDFGR